MVDGQTGAVTFIQRFGKALNVHPHLHSLIPDGLFVLHKRAEGKEGLTFVALPPPSDEEVEELTIKIARRLTRVVERLCAEEEEPGGSLEPIAAALQQALATALKAPVSVESLDLPVPDFETNSKPLCAKVAGFSLHAAQSVAAEDRAALEHLCRYGLRAPFSQQRLSLTEDGQVRYELPHPWPHAAGVTELLLEPEEFLSRLAALVPAPRSHQVRYHGIFASRSKWRSRLPRPPVRDAEVDGDTQGDCTVGNDAAATGTLRPNGQVTGSEPVESRPSPTRRRVPWAQLLLRVFFVDALSCPKCQSRLKVLAFLSDPPVIQRILRHLKLPDQPPPLAPARVPSDLFYPQEAEYVGAGDDPRERRVTAPPGSARPDGPDGVSGRGPPGSDPYP